jgi:hypothetical protein
MVDDVRRRQRAGELAGGGGLLGAGLLLLGYSVMALVRARGRA